MNYLMTTLSTINRLHTPSEQFTYQLGAIKGLEEGGREGRGGGSVRWISRYNYDVRFCTYLNDYLIFKKTLSLSNK